MISSLAVCGTLYLAVIFVLVLGIVARAAWADERMAQMSEKELHPAAGDELMGQGRVVENNRIRDVTGRFFGLCKLTVYRADGEPNIQVWCDMLPKDADIKYAVPDRERSGYLLIWYKLAGY
jgi:hypothetical protein